jgi:hypothetical protein
VEERSRGMVVDKGEDYNKGVHHMLVDIEGSIHWWLLGM